MLVDAASWASNKDPSVEGNLISANDYDDKGKLSLDPTKRARRNLLKVLNCADDSSSKYLFSSCDAIVTGINIGARALPIAPDRRI